jgi:hypothetical protein
VIALNNKVAINNSLKMKYLTNQVRNRRKKSNDRNLKVRMIKVQTDININTKNIRNPNQSIKNINKNHKKSKRNKNKRNQNIKNTIKNLMIKNH